jgi:hypothetical protein
LARSWAGVVLLVERDPLLCHYRLPPTRDLPAREH